MHKKFLLSFDKLKSYFVLLLIIGISANSGFSYAQTPSPPIDFSYAGYGGGSVEIPEVPAVIFVRPSGKDDTRLLQSAIDHVAVLPIQKNGFRGALQLAEGVFHVAGQLRLAASGIVLRGSTNKRTIIMATGKKRRSLIEAGNTKALLEGKTYNVKNDMIPAGSRTLTLETIEGLNAGNRIVITRPSVKEWIESEQIKMQQHWLAGSRNIVWDRMIEAVDPSKKQIILDAPITTALEQRYGGAVITKVVNQPVYYIGIESLLLRSEFDPFSYKDEEHAWFGITLNNVEDVWIRDVTAQHFASSAVHVGPRARRITIENCRSERPVSETGGYRRNSFLVEGQQTLVQQCSADSGMNDFAVGLMAAGPNVFLKCTATHALGASGSYESWASGALYEDVHIEGAGLRLTYDLERAQAGGWTAANSVIWNCKAKEIAAKGPDDAPVIIVNHSEPLYENQLKKRTGKQITAYEDLKHTRRLTTGLREFKFSPTSSKTSRKKQEIQSLQIINGHFVVRGKTVWGGAVNDAWWLGFANPAIALDGGVSITRFIPGRVGPGLTENLPELAKRVIKQGTPFYQSGPPGLWYDRRRDEHSTKERPDANVWAPFLEMPWARSGQGKAWDGLSKYDLSRYNPWYFNRLHEFANLSDQYGIVLYHHVYNNHNLVEVGPHWVDFPWRPANNINETGLPEPPPFDKNNRIHVANEFYDVSNPTLRKLHHSYILHVLDSIGFSRNVILCVGFQFFGPLEFQRFFMHTVAEWERKNNHRVRIVLGTSKDITDAILTDPQLARQVAVIDMRYWQYLPDGSLWAPPGGKNLAFREYVTEKFGRSLDFPNATTPEQAYRQVREYRDKYPGKAIVAWHNEVGPIPALMAGASQVLMLNPAAGHRQGRIVDSNPLDSFVREHLTASLMYMFPRNGMLVNGQQNWVLSDNQNNTVLMYSLTGYGIQLLQKLSDKQFSGLWFDPRTGKTQTAQLPEKFNKGAFIRKPTDQNWLLLLKVKQ